MTKPHVASPLVIALGAAIGVALLAPMAAQAQAAQSMARDQRAKRMATADKTKSKEAIATQAPAMFPQASRVSPPTKAGPKTIKHLQELQGLYEKQDMAAVIAKADEIAKMPAVNAYEKSFVLSMAANAATQQDDQAKAVSYYRQALEANGLDNDGHYSTMFNLAVIQHGLEQYPAALSTVDRFLAETKSENPTHIGFRAGILSNMDRHEEAAAVYQALFARNPAEKRYLMNAIAALQSAEKFDQGNALLEQAYKAGMLTESRELRALYVGYINAQRWNDAQRVMEEGLAKNILQAGPDLARDFQVLAQNVYVDDKVALAAELYAKAAPMAADGEAYLNLAKVLENDGKKSQAKAAAQKALDKGVKKPEEAKGILSR